MASYASSSSITPQPQPQPDTDLIARLQARAKLKSKYARLQREYARALETRKDLTLEVKEKEDKVQRLQDEVDLVIEQIYDSDYAHLAPEDDDLFSDQEDEDEDAAPSMTGSPSVTRQDTNVAMDDEVQTSRPSEASNQLGSGVSLLVSDEPVLSSQVGQPSNGLSAPPPPSAVA